MAIEVLRTASDLLSRMGLALRTGFSFGGKRDYYEALGYHRDLPTELLRAEYRRGGIAKRIVEAYPKATWRKGFELVENDDPQDATEFEEAWASLDKRLKIRVNLLRTDILANFGRHAALLIGAPGDLKTEMPSLGGPDDVLYLAPYADDELKVTRIVTDPENERFGLPATYSLRRVLQPSILGATDLRGRAPAGIGHEVHWSRVIHVAEDMVEDRIYGQSRLEAVFNYLDDLRKVVGGGAEAFWKRADPGTIFNVDENIKFDGPGKEKVEEEIDEFIHGFRRYLALRGTKVEQLMTNVANFGPQVTSLVSLISGTTGIPQRIILGSERGELASTQDKENWDERVADRRDSFAEDIVTDLVSRLVEYGALPESEDYEVRWPSFRDLTDTEKSSIAVQWSTLNKNAGGVVVKPEEIRDIILGLDPLTEEELAAPGSPAPGAPPAGSAPAEGGPPAAPPAGGRAAAAASSYPVIRTADAGAPRLADMVLGAVRRARSAVDQDAMLEALRTNHPTAAIALAERVVATLRGALAERATEAIAALRDRAAEVTAKDLPSAKRRVDLEFPSAKRHAASSGVSLGFKFDAANPEAVSWTQLRAAELVQGISEETRENLRRIISQSMLTGRNANRTLELIQEAIGLDQRRMDAVLNLEDRLRGAEPGDVVPIGDRSVRVPSKNREEFTSRQVNKYAEGQLRDRARTIARTESVRAANRGQEELWAQAAKAGFLDPERDERAWIVTDDDKLCPICEELDNARAAIDGTFTSPDGEELEGPPAHPNCRCTEGIKDVRREQPDTPDEGDGSESGGEDGGEDEESRAAEEHKFSSVQVEVPNSVAQQVSDLASAIPDEDLGDKGREENPHITLRWGLHDEDSEAVQELLAREGPIKITLGKTACFPASESSGEAEPIYVEVQSPDMVRLNAKLAALDHTQTHAEYVPHLTVAYVKEGMGEHYSELTDLEGTEFTVAHVTLSGASGRETRIRVAEWDESAHPRADDGKFGDGGGSDRPPQVDFAAGVKASEGEGQITMRVNGTVVSDPAQLMESARVALGKNGPAILQDCAATMRDLLPGCDVKVEVSERKEVLYLAATKQDGSLIKRSFETTEDGQIVAHHEYFSVPKDQQKSGLAGKMLEQSLNTYQQNGVTTVFTDANIDVGAYAWARLGFKAENPTQFQRTLGHRLEDKGFKTMVGISTERAEELTAGLKEHKEKAPEWLASQPEGKKLLIGTNWEARLDVTDHAAVSHVRSYVASKKAGKK